ncbi:hypothetical protein ABI59_13405 [Acidobacteria bacterium Mor1]|nr:hypothetical protein ABI59_13405 [Acidobacteria bacterium Mor1]
MFKVQPPKVTWVALFAAAILGCACSPAGSAPSSEPASENRSEPKLEVPAGVDPGLAEVVAEFDRRLEAAGYNGAFLIAQGGTVVLARGYGHSDREGTREITPSTAFFTASIAKNFTAAAVLHLVDAGRVRLEDPVAKHLDGIPPSWNGITIHHLLSHTSGIAQNYAADEHDDREAALAAIVDAPLADAPGEGWHYSNDAFSVAAMLIEVVSGRSYENYLQEELFEPAGMTNSGFLSRPPTGDLADLPSMKDYIGRSDWGRRGGSGIATTVEDLHRWWLALQAGKVLSAESLERMLAPQAEIRDDLSCGYGWFQQATPAGPSVWARGTDQSGENGILQVLTERGIIVAAASHVNEDRGRKPPTRRFVAELMELLAEP